MQDVFDFWGFPVHAVGERGRGIYVFLKKKIIMNCRLSVCILVDGFSLLLFQVYLILIIKNRDFIRKKLRHTILFIIIVVDG